MNKYKVHVILDEYYDDIYAEDEETAFVEASDFAMQGGNWGCDIELLEEDCETWW